MKTKISLSQLFVIIVIVSSSCHKPDPAPAPSKTDLISKTWKLTAQTVNNIDVFGDIDACIKDDLFIYTKTGKYTHDEGASKCDPNDPQIYETATWSFIQNSTMLKFVYPDNTTFTFTINQLTTTTLKLSFPINTGSTNYQVVATYTPQP